MYCFNFTMKKLGIQSKIRYLIQFLICVISRTFSCQNVDQIPGAHENSWIKLENALRKNLWFAKVLTAMQLAYISAPHTCLLLFQCICLRLGFLDLRPSDHHSFVKTFYFLSVTSDILRQIRVKLKARSCEEHLIHLLLKLFFTNWKKKLIRYESIIRTH